MNSSIYRFTLDMHSAQSQISIPVLLGDTGRTLCISLSDGGKPYIIADGCLAKISIKRPTGTHLEAFCPIENNTTIVYSFEQNEHTAVVGGIHDCEISLYGTDDKKITSPRFTMVVNERVINDDDIDLSDEDKSLLDSITQAELARQDAETGRVNAEADRAAKDIERAEEAERVSQIATRADEVAEEARASIRDVRKTTDGKLQVLDANGDIIASVDIADMDNDTIYRYDSGVLRVVGIKEMNADETFRMWVGTHEEYVSLDTIDSATFYWVTDDVTFDNLCENFNQLAESFSNLDKGLADGTLVVHTANFANNATDAKSAQELVSQEGIHKYKVKVVDWDNTGDYPLIDVLGLMLDSFSNNDYSVATKAKAIRIHSLCSKLVEAYLSTSGKSNIILSIANDEVSLSDRWRGFNIDFEKPMTPYENIYVSAHAELNATKDVLESCIRLHLRYLPRRTC